MINNRARHTKIKNTGILFELLTRQITVDLMESKDSKAVGILRTYFKRESNLGKEYELYKVLVENKYNAESRAEALIEAVLKSRKKLNNSAIRREKYNLIKTIKESYDVKDFFNARIPNYKVLASISNLFQKEDTTNPELYVKSKYTIVENMVNTKVKSKRDKTYKFLKEQEKDLRLLAYSALIGKFNKKYSNLNERQKTLLKEYINNISNTNNLREYVNGEVDKIKSILVEQVKAVEDQVTAIKIKEVTNQIGGLKKGKIVSDKQVESMMRYYQLVEEIHNVKN